MIRVGLACEDNAGIHIVKVLINRIILEVTDTPVEIEPILSSNTGIYRDVQPHTASFFEPSPPADIGVYSTDLDGCTYDDAKNRITSGIEAVNPSYLSRSVVALPEPHIEHWLVTDEGNLRKYFGIKSTLPKASPKYIINHFSQLMDPRIPKEQIYKEIADNVSLDLLENGSAEFKRFRKDLKDIVRLFHTV